MSMSPSTASVLDACTSPTSFSVRPTRLAHSSTKSFSGAGSNALHFDDAVVQLATTRVPPNHVPSSSGESTPTAPTSNVPRSRPTSLSLTPLFSVKGGKLQHGYPRCLAPYPSNYDRSVIDCDVLDQSFLAQLQAGNPSMLPHVRVNDPTTHPRKTLDLGCGSGAWIISAASLWPQTRFVGFDLVPQIANLSVFEETSNPNSTVPPTKRFSLTPRHTTAPNASRTANDSTPTHRRLSERVRFVHGNFLINGLPFEDGEFDHVRIAGIARGVSENKWDCLLAEVHRVLCDGGHLEMIEEDIIFPILPRRADPLASRKPMDEVLDEEELFYRKPTHSSHGSTSSSTGSSSSSGPLHIASKQGGMSHSRVHSKLSRRTSVPVTFQPLVVTIPVQDPSAGTSGSSWSFPATHKPSPTLICSDKPLPPAPGSKSSAFKNVGSHPGASTRTLPVYSGQTNSHLGDLSPVSGTPNFQSMDSFRLISTPNSHKPGHNAHAVAFTVIGRRPRSPEHSRQLKKEQIVIAPPSKQPPSSRVPRSHAVEAVTRHKHAVLEVLFNSVFEGRFINTSPTAILPSYLNTYFKNLVASPRVDMPTPPAPEGRVKDIFGTKDVNMVPLKPALKRSAQPAAVMTKLYPSLRTHERPRTISRSASIPLLHTEQYPRPRRDVSASSDSEESDFTYWSTRSLATPTTPPEQSTGIAFIKGEERPYETSKKFPSSSLLTLFDEQDDAQGAITSPQSSRFWPTPEREIAQRDEAPITLDAALAAIEKHEHFYKEPPLALRPRSMDVGSLKRIRQRESNPHAEKHVCPSYTRVKARDSAGSAFCLVLPRALFKLDERDMGLHLRKTYMGVIACREAMWEELQRRAKTVTDEHGVSRRTTLLDHVQWSSHEHGMSDAEKFDLLFERFENDMREWCSFGPSLCEQLWTPNNPSPDHQAVPQQKGLKRKAASNSEFNEPLVGRDISRILRVFVAQKPTDGPPLGRRGSRP